MATKNRSDADTAATSLRCGDMPCLGEMMQELRRDKLLVAVEDFRDALSLSWLRLAIKHVQWTACRDRECRRRLAELDL